MKNKAFGFLIFSFIIISLFTFVPIARARTIEPYTIEDSYVLSSAPDTNFGNNETLYVGVDSSDIYISYFKFDISSISMADITYMAFRFYAPECIGKIGSGEMLFYFVESNWDEENITYNSQPSIIELFHGRYVSCLGGPKSFGIDLDESRNYSSYISIRVDCTVEFYTIISREAGNDMTTPRLHIEYPYSPPVKMDFEIIVLVGYFAMPLWLLWMVLPYIKYKLKRKSN